MAPVEPVAVPDVHDLPSRSNRRRFAVWTWTPPGPGPFPALVLLQGVSDAGGHGWWVSGRAHEIVAEMQRSGFADPPVIIMPTDTGAEHGSAWCDWKDGTTSAETWLVDELVPWIGRSRLPVDDRRWVTGLSTGGYGALRTALRHPGLFASATGMSTMIHPDQMGIFVPAMPKRIWGSRREVARNDLAFLVSDPKARKSLRFALDCGADDPLLPANEAFHAELVDRGIAHGYRVRPGDHDWAFWGSGLADHIRFHANVAGGLSAG